MHLIIPRTTRHTDFTFFDYYVVVQQSMSFIGVVAISWLKWFYPAKRNSIYVISNPLVANRQYLFYCGSLGYICTSLFFIPIFGQRHRPISVLSYPTSFHDLSHLLTHKRLITLFSRLSGSIIRSCCFIV